MKCVGKEKKYPYFLTSYALPHRPPLHSSLLCVAPPISFSQMMLHRACQWENDWGEMANDRNTQKFVKNEIGYFRVYTSVGLCVVDCVGWLCTNIFCLCCCMCVFTSCTGHIIIFLCIFSL